MLIQALTTRLPKELIYLIMNFIGNHFMSQLCFKLPSAATIEKLNSNKLEYGLTSWVYVIINRVDIEEVLLGNNLSLE